MYTIYKLFDKNNPSIVRYIGQTLKPLNIRLSNHKSDAKRNKYKRNSHLYNWIKSINYNIGIVKIVDELNKAEADELEVYYIYYFKSRNYPLVNTTKGADKSTNLFYDENGNAKKVLQYNLSGEFIAMFNSMREASDKTGIKLGLISGCCCLKRIKTAGGFQWTYYSDNYPLTISSIYDNRKIIHQSYIDKFSHIILQYDLDDNFIKEWRSIRDIERETKFKRAGIYYALRHSGVGYGYKWICKTVEINKIPKKIQKYNTKRLLQYSSDGEFIKEWSSYKSASEYIGVSSGVLSVACKQKMRIKGFQWRTYENNYLQNIGKFIDKRTLKKK